jgi:hypothetical protein
LRITPHSEVDKKTLLATVQLPHIQTENDLLNIQKLPYFRVIVSLGIVSDILYDPDNQQVPYVPAFTNYTGCRSSTSTITDWLSTDDSINSQMITVKLDDKLAEVLTDNVTVLLGIGVEFGKVGFAGQIAAVKHAGCGKILASL